MDPLNAAGKAPLDLSAELRQAEAAALLTIKRISAQLEASEWTANPTTVTATAPITPNGSSARLADCETGAA